MLALRPTLAAPLLLGSVLACAAGPLRAQVTGAGPGGLNTAVNGVVGGSCTTGLCQVTGGTVGGSNLFHSFSSFDTRGAITGVQIHNLGLPNVVVGVTAPLGSFIDKPVSLSSPGNLFWLSPGGIAVSGSGGFINTNQLTLSTATNQLIGAGRFDVFGTTPQQAALLTGTPGTRARDLVLDPAVRAMAGMAPDPQIVLNGVQLTVDRSLLVDNPGGLVSVAGSTLSAESTTGTGGSITLTGPQVWVDGASSLLATGPSGGGLIQVGGSWQNSNPDVRQAITTWVGSGALLDASATVNGDGGEIVVWSDITNPYGATGVYGTLRAQAGPFGGDGGQVETSGYWLGMSGVDVSTSASKGRSGLWLLDPNNLTIANGVTTTSSVSFPPNYLAPVSESLLDPSDITSAFASNNVIVIEATGSLTFGGTSVISIAASGSATNFSLSFKAGGDIVFNQNLSFSPTGLGSLSFDSITGGLKGSGGIRLVRGAPTGLTNLTVRQGGSSAYSGTFSLPSNAVFSKYGSGSLTLTRPITNSANSPSQVPYQINIYEGELVLGGNNLLGLGSSLSVLGGRFEIGINDQNFSAVNLSAGQIGGGGGILAASSFNFSNSADSMVSAMLGGAGGLQKTGQGRLTLTRTNSYAGTSQISQGVIRAEANNALSSGYVNISAGSGLELFGGITLANSVIESSGAGPNVTGAIRNIGGFNQITGLVLLSGPDSYISSDSGTLVFDRPNSSAIQPSIQLSSSVTSPAEFPLVLGGAGNIVFNDSIDLFNPYLFSSAGPAGGNLIKRGVGSLTLNASNRIGSKFSVLGGTLVYTNDEFFGTGNCGTLCTLFVDDAIVSSGVSHQIQTNGLGAIELGSGGGVWQVESGFSVSFDGPILGVGSFSKAGAGLLNLTGANSYQGSTSILAGTLRVGGSLPGSTSLVVSRGATYELGASDTVGSIAGDGAIALGSFTLTAGANGSSTAFNGGISGSGSLVKAGAGTLTLNGVNSYTGTTTITGGVLTVNRQPPTTATCSGGTSNICASNTNTVVSEAVQAPMLNNVPGFSDSSTTVSTTTTASVSGTSSSSSSTFQASTPLADGSTLISSSSLSVVSNLDSSFTAPETSSALASQMAPATADSTNSSSATSDSGGTQAQETSATTTSGEPASQQSQDASGNSSQEQSQAGESASGTASPAPTSTGVSAPVTTVPSEQAITGVTQADQSQSQALVSAVLPERIGSVVTPPSVTQMQSGLSNAAAFIRSGGGFDGGGGLGGGLGGGRGGAPNSGGGAGGGRGVPAGAGGGGAGTGGGLGPQSGLPRGLLIGGDSDQLMAFADTLIATSDVGRSAVLPPSFNRAAYNPAILHVRFTQERDKLSKPNSDAFLDITLIPREGEPEGRRVELSRQAFAEDLRTLYRQLSRQESLRVNDPSSPSRRLYDLLFAAITPVLQQRGITTLMISADRGLQAVPFAALHNGEHYFGDRYAFSLTPSLALTNLGPPTPRGGRLLAAGASQFDGLAPLPLVPTELNTISSSAVKDTALNQQFTPSTLLQLAGDPRYSRVHVATHAEFLPGGPTKSKLYSGTVPIALSDFVKLRLARRDAPLDLISFSACRTALGDADSELGFAGLALQAGARSAVGTLWYVDDVATSAYFVQMYRYLDAGVPKAEALQLTRQAFSRGLVRLEGDQMVGPDGTALFGGLNDAQQRRVADGLSNPYFWAGIELLGSPW